ncbi:MAG TPA: hypothetical protein VNU66_09340 [Mycobacteriales bacterium]|nr:hypothetical protein [Mycobacteriales bacterium]
MHPPPPPGEPAGRRGNGLPAQEWGALVDVDPRLSEQLLSRLAAAGVAAHVEPAGATTDPVSRAGAMPVRPLHRLWVDVARADAARTVVEEQAEEVVATLGASGADVEQFLHVVPPGASGRVLKPPPRLGPRPGLAGASSPADDDAAWRQIVEGFGRSPEAGPVPPWPVQEDVRDERDPAPRGGVVPPSERPMRRPAEEALPSWLEPEPLRDEGRYVPPPPPPSPRLQPRTLGAVAAVVLGLLVLFAPALLGAAPGGGSYLLGMLLTGGGAGALVYWMRDAPDGDGPDDGAVV